MVDNPANELGMAVLLKFLKDSGASHFRLRVGEPPRFFSGNQLLAADYKAISPDRIRPLIYSVLTPEQIQAYEARGHLRFPLRMKTLGDFDLEAYYRDGVEEALINDPALLNTESIFGEHGDLADEARKD